MTDSSIDPHCRRCATNKRSTSSSAPTATPRIATTMPRCALYHEDAIDEYGSLFSGPAMEFIERRPESQAPMEILHHNITTVNIALDGDYAEGEIT